MSPCSAETSGAVGKTPIIADSTHFPIISQRIESHTASPRRTPGLRAQAQVISLNGPSTAPPARTALNTQGMMPPPPRNRTASYDEHRIQPITSDMALALPSQGNLPLFNYSTMLENHAEQAWGDVNMPDVSLQPAICQYCLDTGYITLNSVQQECLTCNGALNMQS